MSRKQIQEKLGLSDEKHFREAYQQPAVTANLIEMTLPDKPNSRLQKNRITAKEIAFLREQKQCLITFNVERPFLDKLRQLGWEVIDQASTPRLVCKQHRLYRHTALLINSNEYRILNIKVSGEKSTNALTKGNF